MDLQNTVIHLAGEQPVHKISKEGLLTRERGRGQPKMAYLRGQSEDRGIYIFFVISALPSCSWEKVMEALVYC